MAVPVSHAWQGAPLRLDLPKILEQIQAQKNPNLVDEALPLQPASKNLLDPRMDAFYKSLDKGINDAVQSIKKTPVAENPLHQSENVSMEFDTLLLYGPRSAQELLDDIEEQTLEDFDNNTNGFQDDFIKSTGEELSKEEARTLLENRFKAEQKRIDNLKSLQKEIIDHIQQRAQYFMAMEYARRARMKSSGKGMRAESGNLLELPKDGSYNLSGKNFNVFYAFFFNDYSGTLYKISGDTHYFNPRSKENREFFKDCVRGTVGVTKVELELGFGVSRDYQLYGTMSPSTLKALREAAADIKFDLETGIPYDLVKNFHDRQHSILGAIAEEFGTSYDINSVMNKHDELLQKYNKVEAALIEAKKGPNFDAKKLENLKKELKESRKNYLSIAKTINSYFKDVDDLVLAAEPIPTEIKNYDLNPEEKQLFELALRIRKDLKHIRGHQLNRSYKDMANKELIKDAYGKSDPGIRDITEDDKKTLRHRIDAMNGGELPELRNDREDKPEDKPAVKVSN